MPATAIGRISIPKGWAYDVGVSFENTAKPILVKSVKKKGPMWGKLRQGYLVHGIVLGDNRKVEGLNGGQLKTLLENTSKSPDRKLLVQVAFPEEVELRFGSNHTYNHEDVGFEQLGNKIILKKIHNNELKQQILPGMQIGSIFFEDVGVEVFGYKWSDLASCLKGTTNCRIIMWDPKRDAPRTRKTTLPRRLDLELPAGVADLGLQLTATTSRAGEKQLKITAAGTAGAKCWLGGQGKLLSGMLVQTLLVDNYVFSDLKTSQGLMSTLAKTSGRPDRIMMLERPEENGTISTSKIINGKLSKSNAPTVKKDIKTQKIPIPSSNTQLGLEFEGTATGVIRIKSSSIRNAKVGQTIVGFIDKDGTEYSDIADYDLREMLDMSQNTRNRFLVVKDAQWEDNVLSTTAEQECEL
mmetsp:Transcript_35935/g.40996  ORF Transcript_35935/g.40996 Transcript_35935/m.40996 type:complete len:411 (+) Transcript_35935:248-1480(+)